jgi:hypothetical protein
MKNILFALLVPAFLFTACVTPLPASGPNGSMGAPDDSRNWVMIMHGETCDADNVASNMYVENNHETATIVVTVDVTWTESGYQQHQNMTVTVQPNSKTLLGCEWRGNTFQQYNIMTAKYQ